MVSDGEAVVKAKPFSPGRAARAYAQKSGAGKVGQVRAAAGVAQKIRLHRRWERGQKAPDVCIDLFPKGAGFGEARCNARCRSRNR